MIENFLFQEVAITNKGATPYDKFGQPTSAATSTTVKARVEHVQKRIQTGPDTYVDVRLDVWVGPDTTIGNDDTVTYDGSDYIVANVDKQHDMFGNLNHIKVSCR
ncbi:MAG: hypothetical protein WC483_05705 [Candidatus Paceibacterota bacterium]